MKFVVSCILSSYFYKNVLPAATKSTFLKIDARQNAFKHVSFESLLAALTLSIPRPQGPLPPLKIAKNVVPVRVWSTFSI